MHKTIFFSLPCLSRALVIMLTFGYAFFTNIFTTAHIIPLIDQIIGYLIHPQAIVFFSTYEILSNYFPLLFSFILSFIPAIMVALLEARLFLGMANFIGKSSIIGWMGRKNKTNNKEEFNKSAPVNPSVVG